MLPASVTRLFLRTDKSTDSGQVSNIPDRYLVYTIKSKILFWLVCTFVLQNVAYLMKLR